MQDIHDYSMTGAGDGGGGSTRTFYGGDRRMRVHQNNILNHQQPLKCPRCSSFNTKFCYYNNYNLSQPRHFCKNCRRYWTKGGILRNVPVGGGCRKAKRSKSKQPPSSSSPSSVDKPTAQDVEEKSSGSESSSLTAVTATATATAAKAASTDIPNLKLYGHGIEWSTLLGQGSSDGGVFSESTETTPFEFNSINQQCIADHLKLEGQLFGDRTAQVDPNMGFGPLDWGSDQTLFDHACWSQSQWTLSGQDQNGLYLP